jgi:DNA-binding CsgD family transcriptional regulator
VQKRLTDAGLLGDFSDGLDAHGNPLAEPSHDDLRTLLIYLARDGIDESELHKQFQINRPTLAYWLTRLTIWLDARSLPHAVTLAYRRGLLQRLNHNRLTPCLSPREMTALRCIANGGRVEELANEIQVTPNTAAVLRFTTRKKLSCRNWPQAVALAHDLGLLKTDDH